MSVEIVSIGAELLSGSTINTNASYLSQELLKRGWKVARVLTVGDSENEIHSAVSEALMRSKLVITTGGLGPTGDDLTRDVVASIFDSPLKLDKAIFADLEERYGSGLESIKHQATVPEKATVLHNSLGTAPGFYFQEKQRALIALPGVPAQMKAIFEEEALAHIEKLLPKEGFQAALYLNLLSENQVDPFLRDLEKKIPGLHIGICPSYGYLSIYLNAKEEAILSQGIQEIEARFEHHLYSYRDPSLALALHELLLEQKKSLFLAESCTGGRIASKITGISGASEYFYGSAVTYSNAMKIEILGVQEMTLLKHGAVSRETVREMAEGALKLSKAAITMAISGIAGPTGGTDEKPVGTIWAAICLRGEKCHVWKLPMKVRLSRELLIEYSSNVMLSSLYRLLKFHISPSEAK